ncbi:serine/threonine protein kinase [Solirubrobacter ginsenosidimutans]|uniref:non-specific serine/threonine protein kinase n=1 Tax=Solirubrobacter ginsenosidimutans TaxID=490573 RepID=A0A9X3S3D1_9ACTN|nr:serine/threonine-protein kinase [Solirubrobacter ginsenosidimutans]MDA0162001.1 serine/threonine protein kinase [Solirubrobacter ginsenosidimutans]
METTDERSVAVEAELVLGRYRLGDRLGSGGFGTVYEARDERLERPVAVKVIPGAPGKGERGRREALAAGRLDHPGVVAVYDAGEDSRARYLVSELVYGRTLDELSAEGVLSDRDVLRIGLALCGALEHAHGRGVVHRDVKPQNVLVPDAPRSAAGVAKLADFGVAHLAGDDALTRTGDVVGTLAYMAPEQAAGKRVDERCDVYSLALVLYEALAGLNPVRAGSPAATARRVGTVLPSLKRSRKDLPEELCEAIDRALRPRPDERGTLDELAAELAESLPEVSDDGGTVAPHPLERTQPFAPLPRGAGRAVAALLAGGLAVAALQWAGQPLLPALAAVAAVAILPRIGWLVTAVAVIAVLSDRQPGAAVLVGAAALPVPLALRTRGTAWSVPALAPLLGLATVAGAYPALAGRASGPLARVALGALGAWWALLAAPLLGEAILGEAAPSDHAVLGDPQALAPALRDGNAALDLVVSPLLTSGALLYAGLWALAALVLPWLVRGRWLAADVVAASMWAAALGATTAAIAQFIGAPEPRGMVVGAVLAGVLAVAVPHLRGGRVVEP